MNASQQQHQQQQQQQQQEQQQKIYEQFNKFIQTRKIEIKNVTINGCNNPSTEGPNIDIDDNKKESKLHTNSGLIYLRLLESGILRKQHIYDGSSSSSDVNSKDNTINLNELNIKLGIFKDTLQSSDCFDTVQTWLIPVNESKEEDSSSSSPNHRKCDLAILLKEKKWYNIYIGGGFKQSSNNNIFNNESKEFLGIIPKLQFETSLTLRNMRGYLDPIKVQYYLDQHSIPTFKASYTTPLYSLFQNSNSNTSLLGLKLIEALNTNDSISDIDTTIQLDIDTIDWEMTRGYKEFQRTLSTTIENNTPFKKTKLEWIMQLRDILPRRSNTFPYSCYKTSIDAIVQSSQPNLKHSIQYMNQDMTNMIQPFYQGYESICNMELAGPPGDVGFWKYTAGYNYHTPIHKINDIVLHGSLFTGLFKSISYGGLCNNTTHITNNSDSFISDRFFIGGPMQLRGFQPAGIGPRDKFNTLSSSKDSTMDINNSNALGGELYYTASLATSFPIQRPTTSNLQDDTANPSSVTNMRGMIFINAGTLSNWNVPLRPLLYSTRVTIGAGITLNLPMGGRMECTYAVPLRYGPHDIRKNMQVGFGMSFGS